MYLVHVPSSSTTSDLDEITQITYRTEYEKHKEFYYYFVQYCNTLPIVKMFNRIFDP